MSDSPFYARRPALFGALMLSAVATGIVLGLVFGAYNDLPAINDLEEYRPNVVTRILDRNGELISELFLEKRIWIAYNDIPETFINAITATEDARFFEHKGIRLLSILRAMIVDIRSGRMAQGGSTITQQLAKQLFLTPEKSVIRKIKEALLAIQIEKQYTKREILELYCNQIYLGSGAYGIQAASNIYFGKSVSDLSLAESALLAGLPKAPSRYSPFKSVERAKQRRAAVLARMLTEGRITDSQEAEAKKEPVTLAIKEEDESLASHFVETVRIYLEKTYGSDRLYREGLTVTTTLDMEMQAMAEKAALEGIKKVNTRIKRARLYTDDANVEVALVALRPDDGAILAMVGGADFTRSQFNRATSAHRQPGSAFKPFIYLTALDTGFSPGDIIIDSPVAYRSPDGKGEWKPANFSHRFYGPVTLRRALESSINVTSVKLLNKIGIGPVIATARKAGIHSPLTATLSLALGASEVTPLELTSAYTVFANKGLYAAPYYIISVKNSEGEILEEASPVVSDAVRPEVAYVLTNMLKGVIQNGTGRSVRSLNRPSAGKTGTTNDYRDAWFVGYTPDLATGVWVGFDDNRSMGRGETGGRAAAPIWLKFMEEALKNKPSLDFTPPSHIVVRTIDRESGKLATDRCRDTFEEVFVEGTEPSEYCRLEIDQNVNF
ncbi:Multimodular transpeptidase-transglycosylase [hydrothermal vent metagenome]|uniref:peptidoglycan glycosyltransferase n=1 Tax=hydrothermal vent metagenome TaxID=652676 RepID=A0A3B1BKP3_9ZZZZ